MRKFFAAAAAMTLFATGCQNVGRGNKMNDFDTEKVTVQSATFEPVTTETTAAPTTEPVTEPPTVPRTPEDIELVNMKDYIPGLYVDLRYAGTNNFTKKKIYDSDEAVLCYATIKKLIKVQEELNAKGFSLLIWDAYRPFSAQEKLWEVCPDPIFVADPALGIASHNCGNTVDIGLVSVDGKPVDLPTDFDNFTELANRDNTDIPEKAAENAKLLEDIMVANGFEPYWNEWWHYSDKDFAGIRE
ncbi:MAG TPA: M15 family metallopeptidase [Ruminococcus sp.]|nr:M15 family metallopeptidase [Ruminococcus sp.]